MPGIEKLSLEDALDDAPQTRSLLGVFTKDAQLLRKYTATMQQLCTRILGAQREMCGATQALAAHLRSYGKQGFALEGDDSILTSTLLQFSVYLDELSSLHQILATQLGDSMMYPLNKFLQADLDEVLTMSEMYQISSNDHEQAMGRYMKFSKKKEVDQKLRHEVNEDLSVYRRKFHQTALHLYSALNTLQYKRKSSLLEPMVGYMQSQKAFFEMGKESVAKKEIEDFLGNISVSIHGVHSEMTEETKAMVENIDRIEKASTPVYYAEPLSEMPFIPPDLTLAQTSGYLFIRSKQGLLGAKWERSYFFIQGGNLMVQQKDEVAGRLVLDLNQEGTIAEPAEMDDRRFVFHIIVPKQKRTIQLQAENSKYRDEWVATINNVVLDGSYVKVATSKPQTQVPPGLAATLGASSRQKDSTPSPPAVAGSGTTTGVDSIRDTAVATRAGLLSSSPAQSGFTQPSTPAQSGFFPDAPISFDLAASPSEENKSLLQTLGKEGPPKRVNPFDKEESGAVVSSDDPDDSPFSETYTVRFLGSMEVRTDRGEQLVHETIRQIMAARAIHNVFKMNEMQLRISTNAMRLVDPSNNSVRTEFDLEDVSFWAVHKENKRLFGFITRTKGTDVGGRPTYACHVFECNTTGEEICQSMQQATKLAFEVLMEKREVEKQKYIEQQILMANIQKLEEMSHDEAFLKQQQEEYEQLQQEHLKLKQQQSQTNTTDPDVQTTTDDPSPAPAPAPAPAGVEAGPTGAGTDNIASESAHISTDGQFLILDEANGGEVEANQSQAASESRDTEEPITEPVVEAGERRESEA